MIKINKLMILFATIFTSFSLVVITINGDQPKRGENMFVSNILFTQRYLDVSKMKGWDIVVDPSAISSEKYAAEEFKKLLLEATGIDLPIKDSAKELSAHVFIGQNSILNGYSASKFDEEELCVIVKEDMLAIVGGRPRGTLYGVYQFFEDGFGVRFLTADHTYVPKSESVKLPCGEFRYNPPFSFRWSYYGENFRDPLFAAKLRVNTVSDDERIGGKTAQNLISHSVHWLLPFNKYGNEHPEYYALVDGVRDTRTDGGGPQLCVTNPEVIKITAENAIQYLNNHPGLKNISVSQADTDRYCRCESCEEINQREGTPMGSQLFFVNAVAELIEKVHPNVKVGTLAYWYTRKAPKTIKPRHNVQIQLCSIECCTLHPIDDPNCEKNKAFCQDMNDWSSMCNDIWIWNYNTNFRYYDLPFPNLRVIGPNVRYFLRNNAKGVFMQANGNGTSGELSDLRNYLISRMLWNPYYNDREVLEEFVQLHYKSASKPILEYIDMFHDNAENAGLHPGCFPSPTDVGLNPEMSRKIMDYFNKALELADDDAVRARVEKASICAYRAMIEAGDMKPDERNVIVDKYIDLCKRYNMTYAAETKQAEVFFEELKKSK